jgi:hypothetical protein
MRFVLTRFFVLFSVAAALLATAPAAAAQSAGWQPGPGAILDNTYDGYIDAPRAGATVPGSGNFSVAGWFVDKTAQGWAGADDVQIWLGTMDGGGRMLAKALFAQSRPDVAAATGNPYWAASGFNAVVGGLPGGSQTINVYAHTGGKGWWYKSVTVNGGGAASSVAAPAPSTSAPVASNTTGGAPVIIVSAPTNNQNVSTKGDYTIQGTVSDASNVDRVEVWINGERNSQYGTLLGTTTPNTAGEWAVTFRPTRFPSTHSNLYIYAHNRNGQESQVVREINIVDK